MTNTAVADLLARSNRLGADPRNTNYAGGNTSAKGSETDPVTGEQVDLLWVKGSGGDLGTLTEPGLAVLRLDRMRSLVDVYPGVDREDEMVAAFDYCLHGKGGAAPSIDTAMHGLVDAPHVDHLHPDSGIAIATAKDGEQLTKEIFGDRVVWVPWRRPGFQLGLDIAAIKNANPQAVGTVLGGHGITAWGDTSDEAEANSLWIIDDRAVLPRRARQRRAVRRSGPRVCRPAGGRAARQGGCSGTPHPGDRLAGPCDGRPLHRRRGRARVPQPRQARPPRRARHLLPGPLPAHEGQAARRRPALERHRRRDGGAARRAAHGIPRGLRGLLRAERHAGLPRDARCRPGHRARARCRDVLLRQGQADGPRRRRVLRQRDQRHARRRVGVDLRPHRRGREVPHRVLGPRGGQAPADAQAAQPRRPHRPRHRRRERHRQGHRHAPGRRRRVRRHRRPRPRQGAGRRDGDRHQRRRRRRAGERHRRRPGRRQRSTRPCSPSAASTCSSTTPACRSASRCSRRPRPTGTSSTTSWPRAASSWPRQPRGR